MVDCVRAVGVCSMMSLSDGRFSVRDVCPCRGVWVSVRVFGVFLFVWFVAGRVFAGSFRFFLWCVVVRSAFGI